MTTKTAKTINALTAVLSISFLICGIFGLTMSILSRGQIFLNICLSSILMSNICLISRNIIRKKHPEITRQ